MTDDQQRNRVRQLGFWGLDARWDDFAAKEWLPELLEAEESERQRRSLDRRIHSARLGSFKSMADFDWDWPKKINRAQVDELFTFKFLEERANVLFLGPNGVGKSMIAKNLTHQAVLKGHTARFITASDLLNDLSSRDGSRALQRALARYCRPALLAIDELGYLSYNNRFADLLFEVVTKRYGQRSTLITTNKAFNEWGQVFPNATCVVTLVDRLLHNAELVDIEAESYRLKEAKEKAAARAKARAERTKRGKSAQKEGGDDA
jgi:DNA replication protein DnaC